MKIGNIAEMDLLQFVDDKSVYSYAAKAGLAWNQKKDHFLITNLRTKRDTKVTAVSCVDALRKYLSDNAY